MIADREVDLEAARLLILQAAHLKDAGRPSPRRHPWRNCSRPRRRTAPPIRRIQLHGGAGYCRDVPVERYARDARITRIYEGTSEIQRLIIARETLRQVA